jgi:hypothetical protein
MKNSVLCSTLLGLAVAAESVSAAQPPIGFERWTEPPIPIVGPPSGVDFDLTAQEVFQKYAAQLQIVTVDVHGKRHRQKDTRLIDIEVHYGRGGQLLYDVVWVTNLGDFKLDSWFIPNLKEKEVKLFEHFDDAVILDIERYQVGNESRFSIILQRNSGKFDWEVLTGIPFEEAIAIVHGAGSDVRVVDVDWFSDCSRDTPEGGACPIYVDMVLVENTGANHVDTIDLLWQPPPYTVPSGYQLVDLEMLSSNPAIPHLTNWVNPGNLYAVFDAQAPNDVIFNHENKGRVIDLERLPDLSVDNYWTVNLLY